MYNSAEVEGTWTEHLKSDYFVVFFYSIELPCHLGVKLKGKMQAEQNK